MNMSIITTTITSMSTTMTTSTNIIMSTLKAAHVAAMTMIITTLMKYLTVLVLKHQRYSQKLRLKLLSTNSIRELVV